MQWKRRRLSLVTALVAIVLTAGGARAQSSGEWRVFMKRSPCAETLRDWMSVADRDPTGQGGSTFFERARTSPSMGAASFPLTAAGFAAAQVMADTLRLAGFMASGETGMLAKYSNYCCAVWSVWSRQLPNGSRDFAVVRGMGTAGQGFVLERGNMCCEDAAAMAGTAAGCGTFQLSNGRTVQFTPKGPISPSGPLMINGVIIPTSADTAAGSASPSPGRRVCQIEGRWRIGQERQLTMRVSSGHRCGAEPDDKRHSVNSVAVSSAPRNGKASVSGKSMYYQSNPGFRGSDSFSLTIRGQDRKSGATGSGTVIVKVAVE